MAKKNKKSKSKKICFLSKRKGINEKFFDVVKTFVKTLPDRSGKWKIAGVKKLAAKLEITPFHLAKYIKRGFVDESDDVLFINIEREFDNLGFNRTEKTTKQFTIHTFTYENFFPLKNIKAKKNEQIYWRCGLYIRFRSGKRGFYTIQNFPISLYTSSYKKGHKEFFEFIKLMLENFPSMLFFRFNYFDAQRINMGSIEDRIEAFQQKHKKKNEKRPKSDISKRSVPNRTNKKLSREGSTNVVSKSTIKKRSVKRDTKKIKKVKNGNSKKRSSKQRRK